MTVETSTGVVPHDHVVQFYGHDDDLTASVAQFLIGGLRAGEAVVVVATQDHVAAFRKAIASSGIDVCAMVADGSLLFLDAPQQLSKLMGERPDADAFSAEIGGLVQRALVGGRHVRIYGEMVALLWDAGEVAAAIELEGLWNDLRRRLPFSLYCAYHATDSDDDQDVSFGRVCDLHSAVLRPASLGSPQVADARNSLAVARSEHARSFACELLSPGMARRFVVDTLTAWGREQQGDDAAIIVAELATNAIVHARSEFVVAVSAHDDTVRISVRDASTVAPAVKAPDAQARSGRGMLLVAALSHQWGTELISDGKVVWAELTKR